MNSWSRRPPTSGLSSPALTRPTNRHSRRIDGRSESPGFRPKWLDSDKATAEVRVPCAGSPTRPCPPPKPARRRRTGSRTWMRRGPAARSAGCR
jgi:hypothetical protein